MNENEQQQQQRQLKKQQQADDHFFYQKKKDSYAFTTHIYEFIVRESTLCRHRYRRQTRLQSFSCNLAIGQSAHIHTHTRTHVLFIFAEIFFFEILSVPNCRVWREFFSVLFRFSHYVFKTKINRKNLFSFFLSLSLAIRLHSFSCVCLCLLDF